MTINKHLILSSILLVIGCNKKINYNTINKPIYKNFEKKVKISYSQYGKYAPFTFKEYYRDSKAEIDLYVNYKNKVIDSINLLKNKEWIIIQKHSQNYSGHYEKTFIFNNNEYIYYYLDLFSFEKQNTTVNFQKKLTNLIDDDDIKEIYYYFKNEKYLTKSKINLENVYHPRIIYEVTVFKKNQLKFYKIDAINFFIKD